MTITNLYILGQKSKRQRVGHSLSIRRFWGKGEKISSPLTP